MSGFYIKLGKYKALIYQNLINH